MKSLHKKPPKGRNAHRGAGVLAGALALAFAVGAGIWAQAVRGAATQTPTSVHIRLSLSPVFFRSAGWLADGRLLLADFLRGQLLQVATLGASAGSVTALATPIPAAPDQKPAREAWPALVRAAGDPNAVLVSTGRWPSFVIRSFSEDLATSRPVFDASRELHDASGWSIDRIYNWLPLPVQAPSSFVAFADLKKASADSGQTEYRTALVSIRGDELRPLLYVDEGSATKYFLESASYLAVGPKAVYFLLPDGLTAQYQFATPALAPLGRSPESSASLHATVLRWALSQGVVSGPAQLVELPAQMGYLPSSRHLVTLPGPESSTRFYELVQGASAPLAIFYDAGKLQVLVRSGSPSRSGADWTLVSVKDAPGRAQMERTWQLDTHAPNVLAVGPSSLGLWAFLEQDRVRMITVRDFGERGPYLETVSVLVASAPR